MLQRFESKRDTWLMLVIWASIALIAATLWPVLSGALRPAESGTRVVVAAVTIPLILWFVYGTYYVVGNGALVIHTGPVRWRIALRDIRGVRPSRALWSSPALSLDRLRIDYGSGRWVLVSPLHQEAFIAALGLGERGRD